MRDRVDVQVSRVGRYGYHLMLIIKPRDGDFWVSVSGRPGSYVLGKRWARRKAYRMLLCALRETL